jgi:N-acetylglutamate synthase-like GNAT family acetyltransferase
MKTQIPIRKAHKEDHLRIKKLVRRSRLNPTGLKWERFIVATNSEGTVISCGQIKIHRDGSAELASLVVDKSCRGQGIARAVVEYLIKSHRGDLYLMCRSTLGNFYRIFGFEVITEIEMPTYFRRVSRVASAARKLRDYRGVLLVMKRGCGDM